MRQVPPLTIPALLEGGTDLGSFRAPLFLLSLAEDAARGPAPFAGNHAAGSAVLYRLNGRAAGLSRNSTGIPVLSVYARGGMSAKGEGITGLLCQRSVNPLRLGSYLSCCVWRRGHGLMPRGGLCYQCGDVPDEGVGVQWTCLDDHGPPPALACGVGVACF